MPSPGRSPRCRHRGAAVPRARRGASEPHPRSQREKEEGCALPLPPEWLVSFRRVNPEPDGASLVDQPTPLERQQVNVHAPQASTFWHHVRFDIVASAVASRPRSTSSTSVPVRECWESGCRSDIPISAIPTANSRRFSMPSSNGASAHRPGYLWTRRFPGRQLSRLLDVIEHIEDDAEALEALAARMEPGTHGRGDRCPPCHGRSRPGTRNSGTIGATRAPQLRAVLEAAGFDVRSARISFPELSVMLPVRKLRRTKRSAVDFPALAPTVNRIAYAVSSTSSPSPPCLAVRVVSRCRCESKHSVVTAAVARPGGVLDRDAHASRHRVADPAANRGDRCMCRQRDGGRRSLPRRRRLRRHRSRRRSPPTVRRRRDPDATVQSRSPTRHRVRSEDARPATRRKRRRRDDGLRWRGHASGHPPVDRCAREAAQCLHWHAVRSGPSAGSSG